MTRPASPYSSRVNLEPLTTSEEAEARKQATQGSRALLLALCKYGAKHGLPKMSVEECRRLGRTL